jgi:hypothetical protein
MRLVPEKRNVSAKMFCIPLEEEEERERHLVKEKKEIGFYLLMNFKLRWSGSCPTLTDY